jgi:DNA-directed RNA polymerase subunit RPC12/RpoP
VSDRILFPCKACQKRIRSRANKAGQTVQCPQCNAAVVVPGAVEKPPAATPTQKRATPPGESVSLSKSPSGAAPAQPQVPAQLSAPPVAKPKPKPKPEVKTISVRCGSCSTAVDAPVSLIGKSVRCPDCHASIPVRAKKAESQSSTGRDVEATQRAHRGLGNSTQSFGFSCTLCGTRLYAEQSQIGKELTCPDCHSDVRVPTPTRSAPKVDVVPPPENSNEADFNLEDVSERPKYQPTNRGKVSRSDMEMLERASALAPTSPTSPTNPPDASPAFPPDPEESRLTSSATPAARQGPPTQSPPTQGPPAQDSTQGRPTTRKPKSGVTLAAVCPHCHTRLGFREVQIGKRVRCGDCHGEFVVKPAEKKAALSEPPEATDDDGTRGCGGRGRTDRH